jgi:PPOX class probable F420-dependent enzyme
MDTDSKQSATARMPENLPSAEDVERVRRLASADHGLAVVATLRKDGSIQCSVVNAGVMSHPLTGRPVVALVAVGGSRKLAHLRRRPQATVVFRAGWQWVAIEGRASLAGPDDPLDGFEPGRVPQLLREVFTAAGGTHDDWATYDRVMAEERRTAVFVEMDRIYSNG